MMLCFSACKEDTSKEYIYLPKTELHTRENSSGFHREYKTIYKYDEKGNVIQKTEYTKGFLGVFNVRERQYDIEYTYNGNGDISQELIHIEDFCTKITDGHQIYDEGYNYIYNEKQQLVKKQIINPSDYEDAFAHMNMNMMNSEIVLKNINYILMALKNLNLKMYMMSKIN